MSLSRQAIASQGIGFGRQFVAVQGFWQAGADLISRRFAALIGILDYRTGDTRDIVNSLTVSLREALGLGVRRRDTTDL